MIDLHMHSTFSDGMFTPSQLMEKMAAIGLKAAALTDHDVVDGCLEFKNAAQKFAITTINGSELSADYPNVSMEIVALDIPDNSLPAFKERQTFMINERMRVAKERVRLLENLGMELDWQKIAFDDNMKPRTQIGKPHIVAEMLRKGYIQSWEDGFSKFLNKGGPAYVPKNEPKAAEVIAFVLDNGAVPVLAHPIHTKRQGKELFELFRDLKKSGLIGIEVFHSDHNAELKRDYLAMAEELNLMVSGGSDFHGGAHPEVKIGIGKGDLKVPDMILDVILERKITSADYYLNLAKYI